MVQVGIRRTRDLQRVHADIVERLVVDTVGLIRVLDQLVDGQGSVVRLDDGVRDLMTSGSSAGGAGGQRTRLHAESDEGPCARLTLAEGMTEKVHIILSGNSSLILEIKRVPIPDPVPPPNEWVIWNPWRQSVPSASFRTTSRTWSTSSAPSV